MATQYLPDVLLLADLLRPAWDRISGEIPDWHPRNEGDDDAADDKADDKADDDASDDAEDKDEDTAAGGDGAASAGKEQNDPAYLKRQARKHEREKKGALKREAELKARLDKIEAENLSEQEKAIKAAREEARSEALTEAEQTRRADKLELAVTRLAVAKGIRIGEGDKAKTVKFADPDDVQMWLDRQIEKGEIDADDIYKDGKVDADVLTEALAGLATSKPGWLLGAGPNGNGVPAGDADAGKGTAPKASSVEAELASIQKHNKS